MPFPPNFTNAWDTTFPPDTQLANLLGQDLRQVRTDVMQRLSLLSGTLANRPTPETVNATWGGAGFGLLFFATDTSQIFQWNGVAWVDITSSFFSGYKVLLSDSTIHNHTGTTTEDTIYTATVKGNTLGANGFLKGILNYTPSANGAPNTTVRIKFGGTTLFSVIINASLLSPILGFFTLGNRGATNSQFESFESNTPSTVAVVNSLSAIDTTADQNLVVTVQNGTNTDTQVFNQFILELL